jgi:hypothetical protein
MMKRELLKSNVPYKTIDKGVEVSVFGKIIEVKESNASNPRMVSWNYKGYKSAGSMDIDELIGILKTNE